jgi:hypothetical protein
MIIKNKKKEKIKHISNLAYHAHLTGEPVNFY